MPPPSSPEAPSLTVLGGPLDGTRFALAGARGGFALGSDPTCRVSLALASVSPVHARISIDSSGVRVLETGSASGVFVNDDRVNGEAPLRDGDILWLGAPGAEGSVMLQFRDRRGSAPGPQPAAPAEAAPTDDFFVVDEGGSDAAAPGSVAGGTPAEPEPVFVVEAPPAPPSVDDAVFFVEDAPAAPAAAATPAPAPSEDAVFFMEEPVAPVAPAPTPKPAAPPAPAPSPAPPATPPPPARPPTPSAAAPPAPAAASPAPARTPAKSPQPVAKPPGPAPAGAPSPASPAPPAPAPPKPAAAAPPARPAPARRPPTPAPRPAEPKRAAPLERRKGLALGLPAAAGVGLLLVVGAYFALRRGGASLKSIEPSRVSAGQRVVLTGARFDPNPAGDVVLFGDKPARVVSASADRLEVEVPDLGLLPGKDTPVSVSVRVGSTQTAGLSAMAYRAPHIHGLSPDVAMPGEEIVLAGTGWGPTARVLFGPVEAELVDVQPTSLKVKVPAIEGGPGAGVAVVVEMGSEKSNPAPFTLGHLPLLTGITPATASSGDLVSVAGRGFALRATDNTVRIGGVAALVVTSAGNELQVVVPRGAGEARVEVRVRGLDHEAESSLAVTPPADPLEFRFIPEPFDGPGDLAVLATDLGPAFVLAGSGGKSAAQRAVETQKRLAAAAILLKASREADFEVRQLEQDPSVGLIGRPETVLEITDEDAVAYNQDWTKQGTKAAAVSRGRLAIWWNAVARDLVLMLIRSDKPHYAADVAPEGRALGDLYAAARKLSSFGVPRKLIEDTKPPQRDGLRLIALRVPNGVQGPSGGLAGGSVPTAAAPLKLEGLWTGTEVEDGTRKYVSATFTGRGGNYAYEGGITISVPLLSLDQPQRNVARYSLSLRGLVRYYNGQWDGQKLAGTISQDPSGKGQIGTFELVPR